MNIDTIVDLRALVEAHKEYMKAVKKFEEETGIGVCCMDSIQLSAKANLNLFDTVIKECDTDIGKIFTEHFIFEGVEITKVIKGVNE